MIHSIKPFILGFESTNWNNTDKNSDYKIDVPSTKHSQYVNLIFFKEVFDLTFMFLCIFTKFYRDIPKSTNKTMNYHKHIVEKLVRDER